MRHILLVRYHIEQVMNAIAEVQVRTSAPPIHYFSTPGPSSPEGMGSLVNHSSIGFRLNNPPGSSHATKICDQDLPQKLPGYLNDIVSPVERLIQFFYLAQEQKNFKFDFLNSRIQLLIRKVCLKKSSYPSSRIIRRINLSANISSGNGLYRLAFSIRY